MIFLKQLKLLKIESHDKLNFKKGLFSHIFYLRPPSLAELKENLKVPIYRAKSLNDFQRTHSPTYHTLFWGTINMSGVD